MKKESLAMEILKEEKSRTIFWFAAFTVAFAVVIIDRITRKAVK